MKIDDPHGPTVDQLRLLAQLLLLIDGGLRGFSLATDTDRRILLAASLVAQDGVALSREIRGHELLREVAQTTYHRALQRLGEQGLLVQTAPWSGSYRLVLEAYSKI